MEIVRPTYQRSKDVPNQLVYNLPKRLGRGVLEGIRFSSGLWLLHMDLNLTKPITVIQNSTVWNSGISFILTGNSEVRSSTNPQVLSSIPDTNSHYVSPMHQTLEEDITSLRKVKILLAFDKETLLDFANEDEEPFLPFLKGLTTQTPISGQGATTPEIQRALNQIIDCPYSGKIRAIFWEGKAMEIFAYKLEELREKGKGLARQPRISASDIERIHYAAELLVRDPINPPDLTKLAGQIGMSRSKFYSHFKVVFKHSPMEHLRSHRMQVARQLLQQGEHNITEAAFAVGFNSLSYFTRTFTTEFGHSPRQII